MADNKKILIIGSTGGIGKAVTKLLLKEGFEVIGTYIPAAIDELLVDKNFKTIELNLEKQESIDSLHTQLTDGLYAVINCSGIVEFEGKNLEEDLKIWDKTIQINLTSNFVLGKLLYPNLEKNGRFIMISSTDARYAGPITAAYSASKAGVDSLTKSFSILFKDKQIRVNAIAPGWVKTPMTEGNGEVFLDKVAGINPLNRIGKPDDIAKLVKFLLSDDSDYINGQTITIDGGYTNQDPTLLIEEELY